MTKEIRRTCNRCGDWITLDSQGALFDDLALDGWIVLHRLHALGYALGDERLDFCSDRCFRKAMKAERKARNQQP